MDYGSGGEEAVNHWYVADSVHSPPSVSDVGIDRQDAVGKKITGRFQPYFQNFCLTIVLAPAQCCYSFANFANYQCAGVQVLILNAGVPIRYSHVPAFLPAQLRYHIGIEQKHYRSSSRGYSSSLVRSIPSMGQAAKNSLKLRER